MQRHHDQVSAEYDDDQHQLLEDDVPALFLGAQAQVVESAGDDKAGSEKHRQGGVLPELDVGKE